MKHKFLFSLGLLILLIFSFAFQQDSSVQKEVYNFNEPDKIISLPNELVEISGLTDYSVNKIACVQDERGVVFIYDVQSAEIISRHEFGEDADYEGLTRVGNTVYALESSSLLYEIPLESKKSKKHKAKKYELNLPSTDNEGLCYDEKNNQLLIVPKSKIGKGSTYKNMRAIFAFDLKTKEIKSEPLFYFNSDDILKFAIENKKIDGNIYTSSGKTRFQFRPSSIAVHPTSDLIYVLSAEDFGLTIFDSKGNIVDFIKLDKEIYPKAEGITFFKSGDMVITSEGDTKNAKLIVLSQR